jgi:hypothetical protein
VSLSVSFDGTREQPVELLRSGKRVTGTIGTR